MSKTTTGTYAPKKPGRPSRLHVEEGQRFGRGVVIDPEIRIPTSDCTGTRRGARLQCDCGNEYTTAINHLLSGHTKSCGCLKREFVDLAGQRYGKLVVIRFLGDRPHQHANKAVLWLCRCDCGNEATVRTTGLSSGRAISCGCFRRKPWGEAAARRVSRNKVLKTYKGSARSRNLAWELTGEEFDHLTAQECSYCGQPPSRSYKAKTKASCEGGEFVYNGLDRVDNALGYVQGNVVPCCRTCNIAKNDMTYDEFMAWIVRLIDHHWFHPEKLPSRLLKSVI